LTADSIETTIKLRSSLNRVWDAIADAKQFGTWFGAEFDGPFVAGARVNGRIVPTKVHPCIARTQVPYLGMPLEINVERVVPMSQFSFRWHPFAVDLAVDYSKEPTTLVIFEFKEVAGGARLTIIESGFDRVPHARREIAFTANEQSWPTQAYLVEKFLEMLELGAIRTR
jgi:uncharacterized protein YndB with AHSA1/START domain